SWPQLHWRRPKLGSKKVDFNACSGAQLSTFSTFVKLNQSYENISIGFYYCADNCSVPGLVCEERGSNYCNLDYGYDPRHGGLDDDQKELDHKEVVLDDDCCGSFGVTGQEDHEEEGSGYRISFSFGFA